MTTDPPAGAAAGAEPDLDELITAWGLFSEAAVVVADRLSAGLDESGSMSLPEFDVVIRLHRESGHRLPMTRLAAEVGLTSGGFTKLADRMELGGLIVRERSSTDRRMIFAVLTDLGNERTVAALRHHAGDLRRALLDPLGADRLRSFASMSRALRDHHRR